MNISVTIENEYLFYLYHTLELAMPRTRIMYWVGDDARWTYSYDPALLITSFGNIGIDAYVISPHLLKQAC